MAKWILSIVTGPESETQRPSEIRHLLYVWNFRTSFNQLEALSLIPVVASPGDTLQFLFNNLNATSGESFLSITGDMSPIGEHLRVPGIKTGNGVWFPGPEEGYTVAKETGVRNFRLSLKFQENIYTIDPQMIVEPAEPARCQDDS